MRARTLRRVCGGWLLVALLATGACKCGADKTEAGGPAPGERDYASTVGKLPGAALVEVAGLLPADADLALLSDRPEKVLAWLAGRPWWQGIKKSPVWADLGLTGPLYRLSSLRHEVATASPVAIQQPSLEELLVGPVGLALKIDGERTELLVVKSVDLKVQAMERLVEAFNQVRPGERIRQVSAEGFDLRQVEVGPDSSIYYHLFSNLLLVSSDQDMLVQALKRAAGKAGGVAKDSLAGDAVLGKLLQETGDAELVGVLTPALPAGLGGLVLRALPVPALTIGLQLGEAPRLALRAPLTADAPAAFPAGLPAAVALAPLESRLVLAEVGLDLPGLWAELVENAPEPEGEGDKAGPRFPTAPEGLGQEGVLILTGAEFHPITPLLHAALLVPAKDAKAAEAFAQAALRATFGGEPMRLDDVPGGRPAFTVQGPVEPWSPACGVLEGWLVCGTTTDVVRKVMAVAAGQAPSLKDAPGLKAGLLDPAPPAVGLGYLDLGGLSLDGILLLKAGAAQGERFDANDVDDTLAPFLQALGQAGKLGGGLWARPPVLEGSVRPL